MLNETHDACPLCRTTVISKDLNKLNLRAHYLNALRICEPIMRNSRIIVIYSNLGFAEVEKELSSCKNLADYPLEIILEDHIQDIPKDFLKGLDLPNKIRFQEMNITTLPEIVYDLKVLELFNCKIEYIDGDFPNLKRLFLLNNDIDSISGNYPKLKTIRETSNNCIKKRNGFFPVLKPFEHKHSKGRKLVVIDRVLGFADI